MTTIEIKVTNEVLEELNNYRSESPAIKTIFETIKEKLADAENEICEMQHLIYELENTDFEEKDCKEVLFDSPKEIDENLSVME